MEIHLHPFLFAIAPNSHTLYSYYNNMSILLQINSNNNFWI